MFETAVTALYFSMKIESRSQNFDYFNILAYDVSFELELYFGHSWCEGFIKKTELRAALFLNADDH